MKLIDLRSDTVTRPSKPMLNAMLTAEVGDDVWGDDPTVIALEKLASEMLGKEAAVFAPSGTQSNLMGIMAHCQRGDEYIVGQLAHTYKWEGGGAAVLGSIQPQPIDFAPDGTLPLEKVAAVIKPIDDHHARTKLLCIENTTGGKALPMEYLAQAHALAKKHNLAIHLDGARAFNAAVHHNVAIKEIAQHFDSISICLSKGLGAPVGSVLIGSHDIIRSARRWRKVLGGTMRQAGILAAAGIYALKNNVVRLAEDHKNAKLLAEGLRSIENLKVLANNTNMVFIQIPETHINDVDAFFKQKNILIDTRYKSGCTMRMVTHLDVTADDIKIVVAAFKEFLC